MPMTPQELDAKIEQLSKDVGLAHGFVQGDEQTTVPLGDTVIGGPEPVQTPSIRKLVYDFGFAADGQLALAEAAAERAEAAASGAYLASGVYNVRAAFTLEEAVPSGSIITLPAGYYPTRNILDLRYDGGSCVPANVGVGEYQYEEVGDDPNVLSNQITILFDAEAGVTFDMWVVTSALGRNLDAMNVLAAQAGASASMAATSATSAEDSAAAAETSKDTVAGWIAEGFDANRIVSGTIDPARLPNTALSTLIRVQDDTARFALTSEDVQVDDTVYVIDTETLYRVIDESNLGNEGGYQVFTAPVLWEGIQDKPAAYPPSGHGAVHGAAGSDPVTPASIGAAPANITLTDAGASDTLPAVTSDTLQSKIQALRNNAKFLFAAVDTARTVTKLTAALAPNANVAVPSYIVGSNKLRVWYNGVRQIPGTDTTICQYAEVGTAGAASTSIQFNFALSAGDVILAEVK